MNLDNNTLSLILNKIDICRGNFKYKLVCKKWFQLLKNKKNPNCKGLYFMRYKLCYFHNEQLIDKFVNKQL